MRARWWVAVPLAACATALACSHAYSQATRPERPVVTPYGSSLPGVISSAAPGYPAIAREAGVEGTVVLRVHLDPGGRVTDTRIVQSVPMLDAAAVECVQRWRFDPARHDGVPVAAWVAVPIRFELAEGDEPRNNVASGDMPAAGDYFVNADSSDLVRITFEQDNRLMVESPGHWTGAGIMSGKYYWGVFRYLPFVPEERNRGVRGTHYGTLDSAGRMHLHVVFSNRDWRAVDVTWTPRVRPAPHGAPRSISSDDLRRLPVDDLLEHPVWPPRSGNVPNPPYDPPVWPPRRGSADSRIVPAGSAVADSSHR